MPEDRSPEPLRERVTELFGPWNDTWEHALRTRPEYLRAAIRLSEAPARRDALDPKTRAIVCLALNAAVTHLHEEGMREAIAAARAAGATTDELVEVLVVASTLGVHGMNADVLADELAAHGVPHDAGLSEQQVRIREEYTSVRGYWRDFLNPTLELAPDFLEAYLEFSGAPWRFGVLEPKTREFIYLAFDTSPTHLHMAGLRVHIANALQHGATADEIVEVMGLAAGLGLQSLRVGMRVLDEELRDAD